MSDLPNMHHARHIHEGFVVRAEEAELLLDRIKSLEAEKAELEEENQRISKFDCDICEGVGENHDGVKCLSCNGYGNIKAALAYSQAQRDALQERVDKLGELFSDHSGVLVDQYESDLVKIYMNDEQWDEVQALTADEQENKG